MFGRFPFRRFRRASKGRYLASGLRRSSIECLEERKVFSGFNFELPGAATTGSWIAPDNWTPYSLDVTADDTFPSADGLWDIARFNTESGATVQATGTGSTSAGRVEVSVNTTLDLNGSPSIRFEDLQEALPDLQVSSPQFGGAIFTVANTSTTSSALKTPFARLGPNAPGTDGGTLVVTGAKSTVLANGIEVGFHGNGTLDVQNGGTVTITNVNMTGHDALLAPLVIGANQGVGIVNVSGNCLPSHVGRSV